MGRVLHKWSKAQQLLLDHAATEAQRHRELADRVEREALSAIYEDLDLKGREPQLVRDEHGAFMGVSYTVPDPKPEEASSEPKTEEAACSPSA